MELNQSSTLPKRDARRAYLVLLAIHNNGGKISRKELCAALEVGSNGIIDNNIRVLEESYQVQIKKAPLKGEQGVGYELKSTGILDIEAVKKFIADQVVTEEKS